MKKLFSTIMGGVILLTLPMCLTSCEDILGHWERPVPATPGTPSTPTVSNIYLEWDGSALAEKTIPEDAKPLTASETSWSGTYIVKEDVTFNEDVTIAGDVDLIIMDGKTLTINGKQLKETTYPYSFKLSIYAQSEGDEKGKLVVNTTTDGDHPIVAKDIDIHGGDISVAATGDPSQGFYVKNKFYIYGGKITASGREQGIKADANLYIYGGELTANAGTRSIGTGGMAIQAGTLYIYGGTVTANGGNASGSSSMGGDAINASKLYIYGGTVTATGGERTGSWTDGYGINVSNITISGGTVTANGGSNYSHGINGDISITGGNVSATSKGLSVITGNATINGTGVKVEMTRTDAAGNADSDFANLFINTSGMGSIVIGGTNVFADWVTASNKISYFLSGGAQPIAGLTYDTTSNTLTYQP